VNFILRKLRNITDPVNKTFERVAEGCSSRMIYRVRLRLSGLITRICWRCVLAVERFVFNFCACSAFQSPPLCLRRILLLRHLLSN